MDSDIKVLSSNLSEVDKSKESLKADIGTLQENVKSFVSQEEHALLKEEHAKLKVNLSSQTATI